MRGKPKSIEHREKISKSMKGRPSHFKGRTYEEIYGIDRAMDKKRKMSESMKS